MTPWDKDLGKALSEATRWCPRSSLLSFLSPVCPHAPASFPGNSQTTGSPGVGKYSHAEHPQPWLSSTPGAGDSDTPQRSVPWPRCHQHLWRDGDRTGSPLVHPWCLEQLLHQILVSWHRTAHVRDRRVAADTITGSEGHLKCKISQMLGTAWNCHHFLSPFRNGILSWVWENLLCVCGEKNPLHHYAASLLYYVRKLVKAQILLFLCFGILWWSRFAMHSELSLRIYKEKRSSSESTSVFQERRMNLQCVLLPDSWTSQALLIVRNEMFFFLNIKVEMHINISK